jgi:hypothetical protein
MVPPRRHYLLQAKLVVKPALLRSGDANNFKESLDDGRRFHLGASILKNFMAQRADNDAWDDVLVVIGTLKRLSG